MAVRQVIAFKGRARGHLLSVKRQLLSLQTWQVLHPTWPVTLFDVTAQIHVNGVIAAINTALTRVYPKPS